MCGRYTVNTEDEIIELREILQEISRRLMKENSEGNENICLSDRRNVNLLNRLSSEFLSEINIRFSLNQPQKHNYLRINNNTFGNNAEQLTLSGEVYKRSFEAYPACHSPVMLPCGEIKQAVWGFPKWDGKGVIFNARSENISSGRLFSPCLKKGRCLVPASSYFEWTRINGKPADKYRFFDKKLSVIFMAGLFRQNDCGVTEFVIITRAAADNIRFVHSRMPVVLKPEYALEWLYGGFSAEIFNSAASLSYEAGVG